MRLLIQILTLCGVAALMTAPARTQGILVDSIHAHNALQTPTGNAVYEYHSMFGYRRAFAYARQQGIPVTELTSGRITAETLARHRLLFINLVSGDLPPFMVSEIRAIKRWIETGGSLMVVMDHSNCYYHAWKLAPLMEELGIRVYTETACERSDARLSSGNGWFRITRLKSHPLTRGVRTLAVQTGCPVDERYAIAWTSANSWADQWIVGPYGETQSLGFYGNWKQDPGERTGALGMVLARTLGKGRIVVVGDQNLFGDPFILYADNWRLWLNSLAWLLHRPDLGEPQRWLEMLTPRILAYEPEGQAVWGSQDGSGRYALHAWLNLRVNVFAHSRRYADPHVILLAHDALPYTPEILNGWVAHLRSGRSLVVLGRAQDRVDGMPDILAGIQKRMGKPEIAEESGIETWTWPTGGRLVLLPEAAAFSNARLCGPAADAPEAARLLVDALVLLLREEAEWSQPSATQR